MKLRNKKTGDIGELSVWYRADNKEIKEFGVIKENEKFPTDYKSLAELNEEWEDAPEEPKEYYFVDACGEVEATDRDPDDELAKQMQSIGSYFETKEEAEKAVKKLKAWKRLKDKGFKFEYWVYKMDEPKIENHTHFMIVGVCEDGIRLDDLDLLFGGEE